MKIGIVTVPDSANFGSFLQAYALKLVLEEWGHSVVFFRTREQDYLRKIYVDWKPKKRNLKHPFQFVMKNLNGRTKRQKFLEDQELLEIREIQGARYEDFRQYPDIIERIKRIPEIFVRDQNTMDIVEKITGKCPKLVCDPTFLVPVEKMKERYEDQYLMGRRYLAVYLYPGSISKENVRQIRKFAGKEKLALVSVGFCNSWCDYNVNCRPLEFPSVLERAEAVITGTFHGTIFSVLNHKQFVSISLTPKVKDLLTQLGIDERCADKADLSADILEKKLTKELIDYSSIEENIQDMRRSSLLHLKGVITEYDK